MKLLFALTALATAAMLSFPAQAAVSIIQDPLVKGPILHQRGIMGEDAVIHIIYDDSQPLPGDSTGGDALLCFSAILQYNPEVFSNPRIAVYADAATGAQATGTELAPGYFRFTFYNAPYSDLAPHRALWAFDYLATFRLRVDTTENCYQDISFLDVSGMDKNGNQLKNIECATIRVRVNASAVTEWSLYE